jgi:hypothetical protein
MRRIKNFNQFLYEELNLEDSLSGDIEDLISRISNLLNMSKNDILSYIKTPSKIQELINSLSPDQKKEFDSMRGEDKSQIISNLSKSLDSEIRESLSGRERKILGAAGTGALLLLGLSLLTGGGSSSKNWSPSDSSNYYFSGPSAKKYFDNFYSKFVSENPNWFKNTATEKSASEKISKSFTEFVNAGGLKGEKFKISSVSETENPSELMVRFEPTEISSDEEGSPKYELQGDFFAKVSKDTAINLQEGDIYNIDFSILDLKDGDFFVSMGHRGLYSSLPYIEMDNTFGKPILFLGNYLCKINNIGKGTTVYNK